MLIFVSSQYLAMYAVCVTYMGGMGTYLRGLMQQISCDAIYEIFDAIVCISYDSKYFIIIIMLSEYS